MSGEATDLVARLRERAAYDKKFYPPADPMWTQAATLIEAQAAEIEGLIEKLEKLSAAMSWTDYPFIDNNTNADEIRSRLGFMQKDAEPIRAFLASRTERGDADPS